MALIMDFNWGPLHTRNKSPKHKGFIRFSILLQRNTTHTHFISQHSNWFFFFSKHNCLQFQVILNGPGAPLPGSLILKTVPKQWLQTISYFPMFLPIWTIRQQRLSSPREAQKHKTGCLICFKFPMQFTGDKNKIPWHFAGILKKKRKESLSWKYNEPHEISNMNLLFVCSHIFYDSVHRRTV